jgi:hypothetical protein
VPSTASHSTSRDVDVDFVHLSGGLAVHSLTHMKSTQSRTNMAAIETTQPTHSKHFKLPGLCFSNFAAFLKRSSEGSRLHKVLLNRNRSPDPKFFGSLLFYSHVDGLPHSTLLRAMMKGLPVDSRRRRDRTQTQPPLEKCPDLLFKIKTTFSKFYRDEF